MFGSWLSQFSTQLLDSSVKYWLAVSRLFAKYTVNNAKDIHKGDRPRCQRFDKSLLTFSSRYMTLVDETAYETDYITSFLTVD